MDEKTVMNEIYNSTLVTFGTVGLSMLAKRPFGEQIGAPSILMGTLKLAVAVGAGTVGVKYAQNKKWLPTDPFKKM